MSDSAETIKKQIENYKVSLRIISERKSEFVSPTDIPLDLVKNELELNRKLDELRMQLEKAVTVKEGDGTGKGSDLPSPPTATVEVTLQSLQDKHRVLARNYLPKQWEGTEPPSDFFSRYAELFSLVLAPAEGMALQLDAFFQGLADFALGHDLLRIQGDAGTGKTTLLALLYLKCLSRYLLHQSDVFPFFLHLGEYDSFDDEERLRRCRQDLAEIESTLAHAKETRFLLLVDGFDNLLEFRRSLEDEILQLKHRNLKKIVGICLGIDTSDHPQRFEWDETPVVELHSLDPRSEAEVLQFGEAFLRTTRFADDLRAHSTFKEDLARFDFSQVNLRTMALLMRLRRETYRGVNSLFDLLQRYCREILAPNTTDAQYAPILRKAAVLAYGHLYGDADPSPAEQRENPGWLLAHLNVDLRDYLIARHLISCLLSSNADKESLAVLKRVYPYRITRHAKGILTEKPLVQRKAVEAGKKFLASEEVIVRTNVSYFLGRLTDPGAKGDATRLLRGLLEQLPDGDDQGTDALRLLRTIYVSLIYLGDRKASAEYIAKLVDNQHWDHINRGFHLEYYGDIVVDPASDYPHEDTMMDFPYTFKRLFTSIQENLDARIRYMPRELEIYTIFSLAQKRHARAELNLEIRLQLLDLLGKILATRLDSQTLRGYLRMLRIHFGKEVFSVGGVVEDLYRIKAERRRGWVVRGLRDTEHVADHMYGAYLLGLLFLPEKMDDKEYDKETVLRMVLIHDLGEAYTTDILSKEKREEDREREAGWLDYLGMLGTYVEVADTSAIARLSRIYDARNGVNARIAHDLDNLDVFVQLHLYRRRQEIRDFEEWKKEIADELLTPEGRRILDLLQKHFDGGGGSSAGL